MSEGTRKVIDTLWEAARRNIKAEDYERTDIKTVVGDQDNINAGIPILSDELQIFDEFASWFIDLSGVLLVLLIKSKRHKNSRKRRALATLISGIVSQLIAIRRLLLSGLDLPAKQVLRCLVEHVYLAVRITFDGKMIDEFLLHNQIDGPKGAKEFWRKYLRRIRGSHIRDRMYEGYGKRSIRPDYILAMKKFREKEENVLNACTHPSFAALGINVVGANYLIDQQHHDTSLAFYGVIDDSSLRTISYAVYVLLDYVMIGYVPDIIELSRAARKESFVRGACSHIKGARIVVLGLGDYYFDLINEKKEESGKRVRKPAN